MPDVSLITLGGVLAIAIGLIYVVHLLRGVLRDNRKRAVDAHERIALVERDVQLVREDLRQVQVDVEIRLDAHTEALKKAIGDGSPKHRRSRQRSHLSVVKPLAALAALGGVVRWVYRHKATASVSLAGLVIVAPAMVLLPHKATILPGAIPPAMAGTPNPATPPHGTTARPATPTSSAPVTTSTPKSTVSTTAMPSTSERPDDDVPAAYKPGRTKRSPGTPSVAPVPSTGSHPDGSEGAHTPSPSASASATISATVVAPPSGNEPPASDDKPPRRRGLCIRLFFIELGDCG